MSVRNLQFLFAPKSIALIGASQRPGSVGQVLMQNLLGQGFAGPVLPVNPNETMIASLPAYKDVASLPVTPDLAVICTPPATVPGLIDALGRRGVKAAIVITAGFAELGDAGRALQQQVLQAAKPHLLRIIGPNCVGILVPGVNLNASFAPVNALCGKLAFVTQSGAVLTSVLDWAGSRNIGFSHMVSLGGMADVDFGDMLDYLANDTDVSAVLLYVESITHARKFMSAARACARIKPVIVIKAGRHAEGAKAASSHTGALAGADDVYEAAFRRAGMLRVKVLDELFEAVETLSAGIRPIGERLAILTNGGGIGVLATDELIDDGGVLAALSEATLARLNMALPVTWSHGNPVDIIGDAPGARYAEATRALLEDENVDALLVLNCPTAIANSSEAARAVLDNLHDTRKPVLTSWLGGASTGPARALFRAAGVPSYDTPTHAVRAFGHLLRYRRNQDLLMQTPASGGEVLQATNCGEVREIIDRALSERREWLSEAEAKCVLAAYGIPVVETRVAQNPVEAGEIAGGFGGPVALKIMSRDITHKSDAGGVALGLEGADMVRAAAASMLARMARTRPEAQIDGFTVQPMISGKGAAELIVGVSTDAAFGPVILFGEGGVGVEVAADKAIGLPPLNDVLARELIDRTRIVRRLRGYRNIAPADIDAIIRVLIAVSRLAAEFAEVCELDINPLIASASGVMALDARIRVAPASGDPADRLAISPYPAHLARTLTTKSGTHYDLRPIRPEDEPALIAMVAALDPEDARLRFLSHMRHMPHQLAARLTQIDYDREMAFVALDATGIGGVVRLAADPDGEKAEFAVLVRSTLKGTGLGFALMQEIINYARLRGIGELTGDILTENRAMRAMAHEFGFVTLPDGREPGQVRVSLALHPQTG
ncbi:MAG: GNAT family N-acetyltransferase [Pseudomonadota bacterium]